MYIFTEEKWDTALQVFIALHAASTELNSLFTSCHLIHFYFAALTPVLTTWAVQTHISYLLTWVLWAPGDPRHPGHTSHSPHSHRPVMAPPSKLMVAIIFASCLIVFEKSPTGLGGGCRQCWLHQDICLWTMRRPQLRWGHILSGLIRSGVLVSLLPPWLTGEWWQSRKIWCLIH